VLDLLITSHNVIFAKLGGCIVLLGLFVVTRRVFLIGVMGTLTLMMERCRVNSRNDMSLWFFPDLLHFRL
jgi:hypothetical protein